MIACALVGAWSLPAGTAELPVSPAPVVKTAVVKKVRRHRPVRLVAAEWPVGASHHGSVSYLILGVAY